MKEVPPNVRRTFERIKESNDFYTVLREFGGKYYVYRQTSRLDKEKQKIVTVSKYLGRILEDGSYVKKVEAQVTEIQKAFDGHEIVSSPETPIIDREEEIILTYLSMDARFSVTSLAKRLGMSTSKLYNKIKKLEQRYGVTYTVELDLDKFGYSKFIAFAKFVNEIPTSTEIKKAAEPIANIQLAAMLKGGYDAMIYILAKDNEEVSSVLTEMERALSRYPTKWYVSYFHETYSFVPLRNGFFDVIKDQLKQRECNTLRELNSGEKDFAKIDKKCDQEDGRAAYAYYGLKGRGVLKRITINMKSVPVRYIGMLFEAFIDRKQFDSHRKEFLIDIIKETESPLTRYLLVGDVGIPHGGIHFLPVFNDGDLDRSKEFLQKLNKGLAIESSMISEILVGSFCYRKFDNTYSSQYERLVDKYMIPQRERTYYEVKNRKSKASQEAGYLPGKLTAVDD